MKQTLRLAIQSLVYINEKKQRRLSALLTSRKLRQATAVPTVDSQKLGKKNEQVWYSTSGYWECNIVLGQERGASVRTA